MGKPRVEHVFILIGASLIVGAAAWYEFGVRRPQTWPRTDAEVVSSRVVNPRGPGKYTPEIVFRYHVAGEGIRHRAIAANWSSSSYDMVRGYVADYPAGRHLSVAVNPADPDDIRYDLGATIVNLAAPSILLTLGVVFGGIGVVVLRRSSRPGRATMRAEALGAAASTGRHAASTVRRIGLTFVAIGVVVLGISTLLLRAELRAGREWVAVDATVIASRVIVTGLSSTGSSGVRRMYDTEITVRYTVGGTAYESTTRSGISTSSRTRAEDEAARFAPGTSHTVHVKPDDANIVRFNFGSWTRFLLPGGLLAIHSPSGYWASREMRGTDRRTAANSPPSGYSDKGRRNLSCE